MMGETIPTQIKIVNISYSVSSAGGLESHVESEDSAETLHGQVRGRIWKYNALKSFMFSSDSPASELHDLSPHEP